MATISHKNITGNQVHEPKGADTATAGSIYVSDGAGSGSWSKNFGPAYFHLTNTSATPTTPVTDTWTKLVLNSVANTITGASVSTNVITLPAGTYEAFGRQNLRSLYGIVTRLRNTTDSSNLIVGSNERGIGELYSIYLNSYIHGVFTLSDTKTIEFQYYTNAGSESNLTFAGVSGSGVNPVHTDLLIKRIA